MSFLNSRAFLVLRVLASVALIAFIVSRVDLDDVLEKILEADTVLLVVVFAVMSANVVISVVRWWDLLRIHGIPHPFSDLVRWYFIAQFFNNFLPTSIGGDGFRVYRTYSRRRYRSTAFLVVFIERLTGLAALLALGWLAAGWLLARGSGDPLSHQLFEGGTLVGVVSLVCLLIFVWLLRRYGSRFAERLPGIVANVVEHARDYRREPIATVRMIAVGFAFHLVAIVWMWCLARAIGAEISFAALLVVASLVTVVSILPLSINGIGLVDGAFIFLAGQYGMSGESALTFMLLQRALVLLISVFGMALYVLERRHGESAATEAALQPAAAPAAPAPAPEKASGRIGTP